MPYMVAVLGAELRVDDAHPEHVELVRAALADPDDLSANDLTRLLEHCAREAPSVGISLVAEGEEGELTWHVVARGRASSFDLDDLSAEDRRRADDLANTGGIHILGTPRGDNPQRRAWKQIEADVEATLRRRDVAAMMKRFESAELAGTRGALLRARLAEALAERSSPPAHPLLLRALRDDVHPVAHAIAYRLHRQQGIASAFLAELSALARDLPRTRVRVARFASAVEEYGLEVALPDSVKAPAPSPSRTRLEAVEDAVRALQRGDVSLVRKAKRNLSPPISSDLLAKMRERFTAQLEQIARAGASTQLRGLALDLLELLGAPDVILGKLVAGLPERGRVLEMAVAASGRELPPVPLEPHGGPAAPAFDWRDILRCAPYGADRYLVAPRGELLKLVEAGKTRWSQRLPVSPEPLRVVGEWRGELLFFASPWGVHALDATTGDERWVNIDALEARPSGSVIDPPATIWDRSDSTVVKAGRLLVVIDPRTGATREIIEPPFPTAHLQPYGDGVIVLDGEDIIPGMTSAHVNVVESGLVLHRDGRMEDVMPPRSLASVERTAGAVKLELTAQIAVIHGPGGRTMYRLPERLDAIGHVEITRTGPVVPIKIRRPEDVVWGSGTWHAIPLS